MESYVCQYHTYLTYTHASIYRCISGQIRLYIHTRMHRCVRFMGAFIRVYIYIYIYIHVCVHIRTYVCIPRRSFEDSPILSARTREGAREKVRARKRASARKIHARQRGVCPPTRDLDAHHLKPFSSRPRSKCWLSCSSTCCRCASSS